MHTLLIKHKLWLLAAVAGVILCGVSLTSLWGMMRLDQRLAVQYDSHTTPLAEAALALDQLHRSRAQTLIALGAPGGSIAAKQLKWVAATDLQVARHFQRIGNARGTAEERRVLSEIGQLWLRYRQARQPAIAKALADSGEEALQIYRSEADDVFNLLTGKITRLLALKQQLAAQNHYEAGEETRLLERTLLAVSALGIVLALGLSVSLIRSITRPLDTAINFARGVAGGDLGCRLAADRQDEIGQLQGALVTMQGQLRDMLTRIRGYADQLTSVAGTLSSTFDGVSQGAARQQEAADAISRSITVLNDSFGQLSRHSEATQRRAQQAADLSDAGSRAAEAAAAEIHQLAAGSQQSARHIDQLGCRANEIGGIASVIKEIAEQTNLLALNAAIEAARAGDAGRGFAVVADEVRKLAEKTGVATSDIQHELETIQQQAERAVGSMQQGCRQVDSGVVAINSLLPSLQQLNDGARRTSNDLQELERICQEQTHSSSGIAGHVTHIAALARENSARVAATGHTVQQLAGLAGELHTAVSYFRV